MEGGSALAGRLEHIEDLQKLDVKVITITWNGSNELGHGCLSGCEEGLTAFGKKAVRRMAQAGILPDVSHLNERGFWDVAALVEGPFIASHSNAAALVPTERNLSDDQIREIVGRGGFIGMNAMNFLVHERDDCETIAALVDHIDHIVGLGGGDCVGFGFDFNDQILKCIPEDELRLVPRVCRDVVHGHGEVPLVLDELRRRGYREEQVEKIGGGNFLRVLRENLS